MPRWKQGFGGFLMALLGAAGTYWIWDTALSDGTVYEKGGMLFPACGVIGLGLMLFPGYREERMARGEDLSRMEGWRLITARWWVVVIVAILVGILNLVLLSVAYGKETSMSAFENVTVVKKANVYFDGKVTSRTIVFPNGSKKTLGVMLPGEYEFNTADKEIMEILAGDLEVLLPGEEGWKTIRGGDAFDVPAQSKFSLKVKTLTDYCCSFVP